MTKCAACDKRFTEGEDVYQVTKGVYDSASAQVAEIEEVGIYCENCFPALPGEEG